MIHKRSKMVCRTAPATEKQSIVYNKSICINPKVDPCSGFTFCYRDSSELEFIDCSHLISGFGELPRVLVLRFVISIVVAQHPRAGEGCGRAVGNLLGGRANERKRSISDVATTEEQRRAPSVLAHG